MRQASLKTGRRTDNVREVTAHAPPAAMGDVIMVASFALPRIPPRQEIDFARVWPCPEPRDWRYRLSDRLGKPVAGYGSVQKCAAPAV